MQFKDYYKTLGVERSATQDEIKRAYRALARKFHPDINKEAGAEDKFKEIGEAYDVLGNTEKRAAYDQVGKDFQAGQEFKPPPDWDAGFEYSGTSNRGEFSDFFESIFAGARRQQSTRPRSEFRMRGEDHHARVVIDLGDAFEGASRSLSLRAPGVDEEGHVVVRDKEDVVDRVWRRLVKNYIRECGDELGLINAREFH